MAASAVELSKSIDIDRQNIERALKLAADAIGVSDPNPRVGCVIGFADGRILGTGSTQQVGGPHAEVVALQKASAAGHSVKGATAWVTLEPCAHHGRTPPCCDALISAGLKRVVIAGIDPHKCVNGLGVAKLQAAGLEVSIAPPELVASARELNIGFFSRHQRGRPWVPRRKRSAPYRPRHSSTSRWWPLQSGSPSGMAREVVPEFRRRESAQFR